MIVSHNELVAVTNKAFLGMRRTCGEADVIANMVADLQMVGLNGVRHFNNSTKFLTVEEDCPVEITMSKSGNLVVDLHGCSVACHLPVIVDYAVEKMVKRKRLSITLTKCHNRWLAYSELVKLAAKGIACKAEWENGTSPKRTLYVLNRGCVSPELFLSDDVELNSGKLNDMTIELSVRDFDVVALSEGYSIHINSAELNGSQENAWSHGIQVDDADWESLKKTATAILVENSEQSLKGAGELA
ncbi:DUF3726 domain-containing protein [Aliivibrio salmonicida]|uniref:DUF3726 domain-containing protein n=1 Tax=Aliivibrio salmonicida (strain LFI1238) TaxID=316275 RepID=B6EHX9_ALISL|nr:DUF3726 domain-containing protein [Aliivibrio salmonicida]AZL84184.1 DUF3726 domain-containing protein [Aliivibrio salmonicida]CAQ78558.1 hypothetical protein VSAL_I0873 [Aliivibrio salmonicida LFI1238]